MAYKVLTSFKSDLSEKKVDLAKTWTNAFAEKANKKFA